LEGEHAMFLCQSDVEVGLLCGRFGTRYLELPNTSRGFPALLSENRCGILEVLAPPRHVELVFQQKLHSVLLCYIGTKMLVTQNINSKAKY
jgi:hypothetical protein